jgi:LCP family protein required for cell wall assembly
MIAVSTFLAVCLLAVGLLYGYVKWRASQLRTERCPSCVAATGVATGGVKPVNILLIGSNTRTGLDPGEAAQFGSSSEVPGARSDVTMVLHLDPATGSASLLSIPRDLFVPLPAHSMSGTVGKIDAALNDGPDNLIAAITQDLGIPINHFVEINFDGFRRSIDAMGGMKMSFPVPLRDTYSGLNIPRTGCQAVNGATALAVVRARHLQYYSDGRWRDDPLSDLARIRRDHTFLRMFVSTARSQVSNPLRLNALIGGLLNQVTVDSGLNLGAMLDLFRRFRHLDPNGVPETTLPITVVPNYHYGAGAYGDVDLPVEPLDQQVINAWGGQGTVAPAPTRPSLTVVNVSGIYHEAATVAAALEGSGYAVSSTSTAASPASVTESVIRYQPGDLGTAMGLLGHLSGAVMLAPDPAVAAGSLTLDVGSVLSVAPVGGAGAGAAGAPGNGPAAAPGASGAGTATPAPTAGGAATTPGAAATATPPPTSIPTALHQSPSSAQDQPQPYDPGPCAPTPPAA